MTATSTTPPVVLQTRRVLPSSGKEVIIVSLNRPEKLNCFNAQVCQTLVSIFESLCHENENLAAVILTGEGSSFCAGADLSNPPDPLVQSSDLEESLKKNPIHAMSLLPVPLIGALRGNVITGGFELALGCDILVGDYTVVFRDTHCKFHLAPCWGLSQKLQRRIGPGRAKLLSLGALPLNASQAYSWGLLDELVMDTNNNDSALERAVMIADSIGKNSSSMVKRYKRVIDEGGSMTLEQGLKRERAMGLAHYLEIIGDGETFPNAKDFIQDNSRSRSKL